MILPIASIVIGALVYEFVISGVLVDEGHMPSLVNVASAGWRYIGSPAFWVDAGATYWSALIGFVISMAIAVPLGLIAGRNAYVYRALKVVMDFMRPLPAIATIPLIVLLWGPTEISKIFLICFTVAIPLYVQTVYGVLDTNPVALDSARAFGLGRVARLFRVVLPSAAGYLASAIRIYALVAVLVAIAAELTMGGGRGLGKALLDFATAADIASTFALVFILGLLGIALTAALTWIERRLMRWHPTHREEHS